MKQFLVIVLISLTNLANSQITYSKVKYYLGDSTNTLNAAQSIIQVDSVYILAVDVVDSQNNQRLMIVKTDFYGNKIKKLLFGGNDEFHGTYPGNAMILDKDSNLLVCNLYYKSNSGTNEDGYLVKLNPNLDTLWTKTYDLPYYEAGCSSGQIVTNFFTAIKQTTDGGYIVAGNYEYTCSIGNQRSYLIKLDGAGNVEWRKVYTDVKLVFDIEVLPDSSFIFNDVFTGYAINKTDKFGNVLWKTDPNNLGHLTSACDIKFKNNAIYSASSYIYDWEGSRALFGVDVVKLDTAGNILWNKQFFLHHSFDCSGIHNHIEVNIDSSENIFIAGTSDVFNFDVTKRGYKGVILKLNSNGDSLWSRYYGIKDFDDNCQFNDFIFTNDGSMMAVGYHVPDNGAYNFGAWLVKMDSLGLCPGAQTVSVKEYPQTFEGYSDVMRVYPNPTNENVQIDFKEAINKPCTIEVYDLLGQKVLSKNVQSGINNLSLNVTQLKAGIYLIYALDKKGIFAVEKLQIIK